jgi:hypothetical protein
MKTDYIVIKIGQKPFGKYKVVSKRAYENDLCALITFYGQEFIWIPTWAEVGSIVKALFLVENMNRINKGDVELSFIQYLNKMGIDEYMLRGVNV